MSSANIMQACVARNVGTNQASVITYAKNLRHVSPPYITQAMLKDSSNLVSTLFKINKKTKCMQLKLKHNV